MKLCVNLETNLKVIGKKFCLSFLAAVFLFLPACQTMSPFSERAYNYVITTKVEALALMNKATTSYNENSDAIDTFTLDLEKAKSYDKNRGLNSETNQMWDILTDPSGHLLGGFMVEWKKRGSMSAVYIGFRRKQVEKAFDELAQLEQGKSHSETLLRY